MALILQLPPGSQFYQPLLRFDATFNAPLVGGYDWSVAANVNVPFQLIRKNQLYLIERYSFSATIPEGDFFGAVLTVPTLSVRIEEETNRQIYPTPIPLLNYVDGLETLIYAYGNQDQQLTGTFAGQLNQTPPLVGVPVITAQVQFNIYEVKNKDWIENFLGRTQGGQAVGLVLGGRKR